MKIGKFIIGHGKPFVIAEVSGNHNKSLKTALKLIKLCSQIGAQAIKFQTFLPNEITLNHKSKYFKINDKNNLWNGQYLYDLYKKSHMPRSWYETIIKEAKLSKILLFSSVFDFNSLDFLEKLNVPAYKIASFESNHFPLIKEVAKTNKPIIVSTGMNSLKENDELVDLLNKVAKNNFCLLKCTSTYPASPINNNLLAIKEMKNRYKCEIGLSDHTKGITTPIAATALGASIIEKHVMLKKTGIDSGFSINIDEFKKMILEINHAYISLGSKKIQPSSDELKSRKYRRSIFVSENINKGDTFTMENIKIIRPNYGMHPKYFHKIIGKVARRDYLKGEPLKIKLKK